MTEVPRRLTGAEASKIIESLEVLHQLPAHYQTIIYCFLEELHRLRNRKETVPAEIELVTSRLAHILISGVHCYWQIAEDQNNNDKDGTTKPDDNVHQSKRQSSWVSVKEDYDDPESDDEDEEEEEESEESEKDGPQTIGLLRRAIKAFGVRILMLEQKAVEASGLCINDTIEGLVTVYRRLVQHVDSPHKQTEQVAAKNLLKTIDDLLGYTDKKIVSPVRAAMILNIWLSTNLMPEDEYQKLLNRLNVVIKSKSKQAVKMAMDSLVSTLTATRWCAVREPSK